MAGDGARARGRRRPRLRRSSCTRGSGRRRATSRTSPTRWSTARSARSASAPTSSPTPTARAAGKRPGECERRAHRAAPVQPDVQDAHRARSRTTARDVYLRPETAQGIFVNFKNVAADRRVEGAVRHRADRQVVPQRDHPAQLHLPHARVRADGDGVLLQAAAGDDSGSSTGRKAALRVVRRPRHQAASACACASTRQDELAHYAKAAPTSSTSSRSAGRSSRASHNRTDFDLKRHTESSRQGPLVLRRARRRSATSRTSSSRRRASTAPSRVPLRRLRRGAVEGEDERVVLRLHPRSRRSRSAMFPLVKKDGHARDRARDRRGCCSADFAVFYDEAGAIGRRYRRQDEAGTPFCVTVDQTTKTTARSRCATATR